MGFFSRNSRQSTPDNSPFTESPVQEDEEEQPSSDSKSPGRMSKSDSEGYYPSWLPKRPPPPAPASTLNSVGIPEAGPSNVSPHAPRGRKPTPRSVRIVGLDAYGGTRTQRQEATDQTKVNAPPVLSRATGTLMAPTVLRDSLARTPQPRFNTPALHPELLRNPTISSRIHFAIWPLIVFAHIPLQTFFDFNVVYAMLQVVRFPNPQAPGVPGSGKNWALGTAAYIASWAVWILCVFIGYELLYSFARRWRVKRPLIVPIYISAPAFKYACMSSYTNFCFFQYIRKSAFHGERGGLRDGLAETFWWYGQNLPTVALLLPRAALSLAMILEFSSPQVGIVALADAGISHRDSTFFRPSDGTLTSYAYGILLANAAWTAWRTLVLFGSWMGLWIISGQGCGGICGPRDRWEEDEAEKTLSVYTDNLSEYDTLPWSWRQSTRARIQYAHDFCSTLRRGSALMTKDVSEESAFLEPPLTSRIEPGRFENMDQILAAVGLPSSPVPARRGVLSEDLFRPSGEVPRTDTPPELATIIPKVIQETSRELERDRNGPLMALPYPFTTGAARASSSDRVPFPPSPDHSEEHITSSGSRSLSVHDVEIEAEQEVEYDADPSSGRQSGSMSSLGHPLSARYPFQFRVPNRGTSMSSGAQSRMTPSSNDKSIQSRISQGTQSTGNQDSLDSHSPRSHRTTSSEAGIPLPPRHPNPSRPRAGTVPISPSLSSSSSPMAGAIIFPTRTGGRPSFGTVAMSSSEALPIAEGDFSLSEAEEEEEYEEEEEEEEEEDEHQMMEQPEVDSDDSHEVAERDDHVALLSPSVSPRSSRSGLRQRASTLSFPGRRRSRSASGSGSGSGASYRTHSRTDSNSRSRTGSGVSHNVRSRTQSLIHSVSAASRSSLELVQGAIRTRATSSIARLSDEAQYSSDDRTHSRSGSSDATGENHTFGQHQHLRSQWQTNPALRVEEESEHASSHGHDSPRSVEVPAAQIPSPSEEVPPVPSLPNILVEEPEHENVSVDPARFGSTRSMNTGISYPDVSTARASMITESPSMEGTTSSSDHTASLWEGRLRQLSEHSESQWHGPA